MAHTIPTLRRRYAVKLIASIAAAITGVGLDFFISRALGPAHYGEYYFLQQFFLQIFALLSASISFAFVTRVARRPLSRVFTLVYVTWLAVVAFLFVLFITICDLLGIAGYVWPGSATWYVTLAALGAYFTYLGREGTSMGDAYGMTVRLEIARTLQRLLALLILVVLFLSHYLTLESALIYTCVVNAALAGTLLFLLRRHKRLLMPVRVPLGRRLLAAGRYLYDYSAPLAVYLIVTAASVIFDRWLLQVMAGSVSQGYYSLATQISQVMLLFAAAFVPLLMREMSVAYGEQNTDRLRRLFGRSMGNLYFVAAAGSCYAAVFCDRIAHLVGGNAFAASAFPVAIVVLSTVHRTYGQVTSTLMLATGQTKLYRDIAIVTTLLGTAMTWLLVAPPRMFGLGLADVGLAIKTFIFGIISVNMYAYYCCRYLQTSFKNILWHQSYTLAILLATAGLVRVVCGAFWNPGYDFVPNLAALMLTGTLYVCITALVVYVWPAVAGLDRVEARRLIQGVPFLRRSSSA